MKKRSLFLVIAMLLGLCTTAYADEEWCPEAETQLELNDCAAKDLKKSQSALEEAYTTLQEATKEGPQETPLTKAQSAWEAYRDAHCDMVAAQYHGGSLEGMTRILCLAEENKARAEALKTQLNEQSK